MFSWLEKVGDFFNAVTSPIDALMAWVVKISVEALSWVLGAIIDIMKLSDTFAELKFTRDIFFLINTFTIMLAVAVGTYYIFSQLLTIASGGEGQTPRQILGAFLNFGFRILSMPFFLFFLLFVNRLWIDTMAAYGLNPAKIIDNLKLSDSDPTAFLGRITGLFTLPLASILLAAIMALVLAIILLILFFQLIRRTGEIFFLYIFIPPVALSVLTSDLDMYSSWWRQAISVIGGQMLQVVGIYASFQFLIDGHGILGMGVLMATISTPAVMKEYAYNSGTSGFAKQGMTAAMFSLLR